MNEFQNIAVLIDSDNTQYSKIPDVLREISTHGRITVKRAYGNWKKGNLGEWEHIIKENAIHAIQQYDYVTGKNATDMALVIDTIDLAYKGIYDAFVIVASDSDYTPLAIRLRENGVFVIGVGKENTADSFKKSCDDFIVLENLSNDINDAETIQSVNLPNNLDEENDLPAEIHYLLRDAYSNSKDENGYVNIGLVGSYIKRIKPDFDTRSYGYKKLSEMIADFPNRYKVHLTSHGCTYKCLNISQQENMNTLHKLLKSAYDRYKNENGYAHIGPVGSYVKENLPSFDYKKHGYKNITDLIKKNPKLYQYKKGNSTILFRCVK